MTSRAVPAGPVAGTGGGCPQCGTGRGQPRRCCLVCGYDFLAGAARTPPEPETFPLVPSDAAWEIVVGTRASRGDDPGSGGPQHGEPVHRLTQDMELIGRRDSRSAPSIDLGDAPADPAVSHRHAVLRRREDNLYVLEDLGSMNGTWLNDDPQPLPPYRRFILADQDRIVLGGHTVLTLRRAAGAAT